MVIIILARLIIGNSISHDVSAPYNKKEQQSFEISNSPNFVLLCVLNGSTTPARPGIYRYYCLEPWTIAANVSVSISSNSEQSLHSKAKLPVGLLKLRLRADNDLGVCVSVLKHKGRLAL
jgi:hypothetical protein